MHLTVESRRASPFVAPAAVETWDTWFRWRENGKLLDDTVEATWRRIASALASVEPQGSGRTFERRLLDAFADWRLLLDERILATAGTGAAGWPDDGLVAVLNAVSFIRGTAQASLDLAAVQDCAALAVRALDNAIALGGGSKHPAKKLRIGLVGFADALASLDLDHGTVDACACAQSIARALAEGALRETVALASMRGGAVRCDTRWIDAARQRGMPAELIDLAQRYGLRHAALTAITSQPRLARFANDASDAICPRAAEDAFAPAAHHGSRAKRRPGVSVPAQLDMHGAMQPWIDEPIACPVRMDARPAPAPRWRQTSRTPWRSWAMPPSG